MSDVSKGDTKLAFSLSANTRKRKLEPSSAVSGFENEEVQEQVERAERTEPLIIPLQESDRMTVLERKLKTQDELVAEALTQAAVEHFSGKEMSTSGTNFSATGDLVISSGQNTNVTGTNTGTNRDKDKQQYLKEIENLPDEADDDAYDRIPVSEFGAALLRGMGWSGSSGETSNAPPPPAMRPHRLGLGATPKVLVADAIPGKIRTADQVKRDEKLQKQHDGFSKQRQERMAQDKQKTLQIGSLVYCHGRRAKLLQLQGVPGLSRVLLQFEREVAKTSVKKGEITLIPRPELDERPFQEVDLDENRPEKLEPNPMQKTQHTTFEIRSKNDDARNPKHRDDRFRDDRKETKKLKHRDEERGWLIPNIRVRVITKRLGSNQYKEKGVVIDVTHSGVATLQMSNGQLLDRVPERYLETALPKIGGNAVVLAGKGKFAKGKLLERDSKAGKGVIQVFDDMSVLRLSLDDMAEWVGHLDDDMME